MMRRIVSAPGSLHAMEQELRSIPAPARPSSNKNSAAEGSSALAHHRRRPARHVSTQALPFASPDAMAIIGSAVHGVEAEVVLESTLHVSGKQIAECQYKFGLQHLPTAPALRDEEDRTASSLERLLHQGSGEIDKSLAVCLATPSEREDSSNQRKLLARSIALRGQMEMEEVTNRVNARYYELITRIRRQRRQEKNLCQKLSAAFGPGSDAA